MPSFSYNANIPQSTDNPADSQGQMLTNFGSIYNILGVDHFTFGSMTATDGQHQQVTLPVPLSGTPATPSGSASEIYTNAISAVAQLFFINSAGANQLTGLPLITTTPSATGYGITTPWGLVLNWGSASTPGTSNTVVFQVPFPNSVDCVIVTPKSSGPGPATICSVNNTTKTQFTLYVSTFANPVFFFAIGH